MTPDRGDLFLGGIIDPESGERTEELLHYPRKRFTTHGVIVGMTGSGKTGLGVVLLEEVLSSGVPALILDPKGDMGNLFLNFPSFAPSDFEPWVDVAQAERKGITVAELASGTAELWRNGLEGWGIGSDRMRALGTGVDFTLYTPGSTVGVPMNILGSLNPPALSWESEAESLLEEIEGFVSGLLTLVGIDADPISSPEHILLATLVERAWRAGTAMDLATLIRQLQNPPVRKVGVFELDQFFPEKDRMKLAMRLNGLLASPSFGPWMQGDPLDMGRLLHTSDGRPRAAIVHLAHLSDEERQFVVTMLLSKMVSWMRGQPGTSDLRAMVYMDEIFGFAPPVAEPPSKKLILTLFKQARAHGVGMVVATQNPVDLDYKIMSNAGTWMIGRLQTERDKMRIIEGLESSSGDVDIDAIDRRIGELGKRQFVLRTAGTHGAELFTSRWAMSFLRGPLSRQEVSRLMADRATEATASEGSVGADATAQPTVSAATEPPATEPVAENETTVPPTVASGVRVYHLDPAAPWAESVGASSDARSVAAGIVARVDLTFDERHADVDHRESWEAVFFPLGTHFDAGAGIAVDHDTRDFRTSAATDDLRYRIPDAPIDESRFFRSAESALKEWLYRHEEVVIYRNTELKAFSRVGESREAFATRCRALAEDAADAEAAKLRDRFETKIKRVSDQLSTAERRIRELEQDVSSRRQQEAVSGVGELISIFLGGKRGSRSLGGFASRRSMTRRTSERLRSAEEKADDKAREIEELEDQLGEALIEINEKWDRAAEEISEFQVGLEKNDIAVDEFALVWIPTK